MVVYNTDIAAAVYPKYRATSRVFDMDMVAPTDTMGAILDPRDHTMMAMTAMTTAAEAGTATMVHYIVVVTPDDAEKMECPFGWEGRHVACLDRSAWNVARAIAGGYHIRDRVDLRKVPLGEWYPTGLADMLREGGYDAALVAVAPSTTLSDFLGKQEGVRLGGLGKPSMTRVAAFHPYCQAAKFDMSLLFKGLTGAEDTVSLRKVVLPPRSRVVAEGFDDGRRAEYEWSEPAFVMDDRYRCFSLLGEASEMNIVGRDTYYQCVSKYGSRGEAQTPGIWDAKCTRDEDCAGAWASHGGRCDVATGVCQVPVGVKQVSYRVSFSDNKYHRPFRKCADGGVVCAARDSTGYLFPSDLGPGGFIARFPDHGDE